MGRKQEPGISYYPVQTNHIYNNKIRLLYNEFGADGYWIWSCLLSRIYEDKGYYLDIEDEDELELFATDVCRKQVPLVKEVINGCVRRGLYDRSVFDSFKVLTNDRIQLNYIEATSERRRKGTEITIIDEFLVIDVEDTWKNVVVTRINLILPRKKAILPRNNPHSKVKESKVKESKVLEGAAAPVKKSFKEFTQQDFIDELANFKDKYPKDMLNAFYKYWKEKSANGKMRFQLEKTWEIDLRLDKWKRNNESRFQSIAQNEEASATKLASRFKRI
jgi:hypothetical protein